GLFSRRRQADSRAQQLHDGGIAAGAGEDEDDGREQSGAIESFDHDGAGRGPHLPRAEASPAPGSPLAPAVAAAVPAAGALHPRIASTRSGEIGGLTPGSVGSTSEAYRSTSRGPTMTCCHSGTGRCSETI